jgi:hypothetical protein
MLSFVAAQHAGGDAERLAAANPLVASTLENIIGAVQQEVESTAVACNATACIVSVGSTRAAQDPDAIAREK